MKAVIEKIKRVITGTEFEGNTYIAGGYVRDLVLQNDNSDLDIAVALPQGGTKLAALLYYNRISTKPVIFEQFGTALVEIDGQKIEFVMTRNESYRKGNRKPTTSPGTLLEDISRRDFTINSLVMDIMTGKILDLTGKGLSDLQDKVIRATSDPDFIFHDDPLRILRAVRFANRLRFKIEKTTAIAMKNDSYELTTISWERRRDEFIKILLSKTPQQGLELLFEYKLMKYIIPELENQKDNVCYKEIEILPAVEELRLAALLQNIAARNEEEVIGIIIDRLRLSSKLKYKVNFLVNYCHCFTPENQCDNDLDARKLVYYHQQLLETFIKYYSAFAQSGNWQDQPHALIEEVRNIEIEFKDRSFPLNGNIIKQEFTIPECEEIGRIKEKGLHIWLKHPEMNKEELLRLLKKES
jgi:tRNA nucleotidyltransferase/poly(A) polymerase